MDPNRPDPSEEPNQTVNDGVAHSKNPKKCAYHVTFDLDLDLEHWLPVRQRIQYQLASLAFRALSGLAPDYLAGDCQLVADSGRRSLRSAERRVCTVPRQNSTFGDRSFAAAGPRA